MQFIFQQHFLSFSFILYLQCSVVFVYLSHLRNILSQFEGGMS
uniref:Uncharacterized protein n=1 Tax=Anguilla anguilla TaxID=7936 RepID=A0A0E9UV05_ANGAN